MAGYAGRKEPAEGTSELHAKSLALEDRDGRRPILDRGPYSNVIDNDYVASQRVIEEGGYEADNCPWKPTLEERIVGKVHELIDR